MRGLRSSLMVIACLVALVAVLALAPASFAQQSSVGTYGGQAGEAQGVVQGQEEAAEAGGLPLTGLDLGLAIGGGLVLIGVGAALARLTPRETP
jgi:hypothetical protein